MFESLRRLCAAVCLTVLSIVPGGAAAQDGNGGLSGVVRDPSGALVPGARVTLTAARSDRGRPPRLVTSGADGTFRFADLPEGRYVLRVEIDGFTPFVRDDLALGPTRATVHLSIALVLSGLSADVVVSAERLETVLRDAPSSVSVIANADITGKGARYIGDELVGQPGVFVNRADDGAYASVTLRGVPEVHHNDTFLALVDGMPIVSANDEVSLELIPLDIVDRVEVVRGPTSALYGRGGIAGAVNYITRSPAAGQRDVVAELTYGSYNFVKPRLMIGTPLGSTRNTLLVTASGEAKDGWRDRTSRRAGSIFAKDQWLSSSGWLVTGYVSAARYRQGTAGALPFRVDGSPVPMPGGRTTNLNIDNARHDNASTMTAGSVERALADGVTFRTRVQYRYLSGDFIGGFNQGIDEEAQLQFWNGFAGRTFTHNLYVEPQVTWNAAKVRFVAGAALERVRAHFVEDWTGEYGFNPETSRFAFYEQARSYATGQFVNREAWITDRLGDSRSRGRVAGVYAQAQVDLTARIFATIGARYESYARTVDYGAVVSAGEPQPAATSTADDARTTPKVSLSVRPSRNMTTYVSYAEGFSPAFGAVFNFKNRGPDLRPEISRNYEGGVKADVLGQRLFVAVTGFQLDRRDLLQEIVEGTGIKTINAGRQRVRGLEMESRLRATSRTTLQASYSYTSSTWLDNQFVVEGFDGPIVIDYSGKRVLGIPPHLFSTSLVHTRRGVTARVGIDVASEAFVDGENTLQAGSYALVNASAIVPLRDTPWSVQVNATNLLDREFYYYRSYRTLREASPGQPLQLGVTLRYAWR